MPDGGSSLPIWSRSWGGRSDVCRHSAQEEVPLNWNAWVRQVHRWLAVAFTAAVIANIVALVREAQAVWIGLAALFPLVLLMLTGLYMFVLPYAAKRHSGRTSGGVE
jgi:cellulose synthase/poly-beta-1,6-N-acetylglucosamine synthase-like glycosyltransferase